MNAEQKIEQVIREFFDEAAGVKLEADSDGWLFDGDSNWGFKPADLAHSICALVRNLGIEIDQQ